MSSTINAEQALAVLRNSDMLYSAEHVNAAVERMARAITARLEGTDPLILVVMHGALIPASLLFLRLNFPLQISYLHVTRYRGATSGGEIHWVARPNVPVAGRIVLVVDDIFDEGHTLKAIVDEMHKLGAAEVLSAVLVDKKHDRPKEKLKIDFIGMEVEDRYVFGCGMDYKEYWRNLPGIYALKQE
ncbi:MAG: hypoxanthine-guanine phosphoribosyltransferase [Gammaproteobacteria bacterium]